MHRTLPAVLSLLLSLLTFGCSKFSGVPYSTSAEPEALIRLIPAPPDAEPWLAQPRLAGSLGTDRLLLILARDAGDEQTLLSAYWFGRRGNRWYLQASQPDFSQGSTQDAAPRLLKPAPLAPLLAIETTDCHPRRCNRMLQLFATEPPLRPVLEAPDGLPLAADTRPSGELCDGLMALPTGSRRRTLRADYDAGGACFAIDAEWLLPQSREHAPELVIHYTGKRALARPVQTAAPQGEDDEETADAPSDAPPESYQITILPIRETLSYRWQNGAFQHSDGRNPAQRP